MTVPTVIFLGSWLPRKGTRTLALAAAILESRGVQLNWLLCGTHCDRSTIEREWPDAARDRLEVVSEFEPQAEQELLSRGEIFVLPSFFEGQPLALLQAMESGLCCVSTDCCGQRDLITNGENGVLFAAGSAEGLAGALEGAVRDGDLRNRLGSAARDSVKHRTWAVVADEFVERVEVRLSEIAAP